MPSAQAPEPEVSKMTMAHKPVVAKPVEALKSPKPAVNGNTNGFTGGNGYFGESHNSSQNGSSSVQRTRTSKTTSESRTQFSKDQQITVLRETVITTRRRFIADFENVDDHCIDCTSINSFLDYIERERLTHMPHRGSKWDKVLKWAEFFAVQISGYAEVVKTFVPDSKEAAKLIWAASRTLLELGPHNADALEMTFAVFYKFGLSLSFFLRHNKLLAVTGHIRAEVGEAFNAILLLVREVSLYYKLRISDISSHEVTVDFNHAFGRYIDAFHLHKNRITDDMWEHVLGDEVSVGIRTVRNWLGPRDRTLQAILDDRLAARNFRDEYTCEWFQRYLMGFSRGRDDVLLVTGEPGSGKSVLAGWIVERLQRPLGRKTYQSFSYSIEADLPSEATSLAVAKGLCLQLLENNVGDVALFNALADIVDKSVNTRASHTEEALWKALHTGLDFAATKSKEQSHDLMIVIDGLDRVRGGERGAKDVFQHLSELASRHGNIQVLVLSAKDVTSTKGKIQRLPLTKDHAHNDVQLVLTRILGNYAHFRDQTEHQQEAIVDQIGHAAQSNFLLAILTAESLMQETSHEGFSRAVKGFKEAPKSLKETIHKIVHALDFNKADLGLVLSWMLVAERPLDIVEIQSLLRIDLQRGHLVDHKVAAFEEVLRASGSLLVVQNGIVRFRHSAIRAHLADFHGDGKKILSTPAAHTDLVMRSLAYTKHSFKKEHEPSFERVDPADIDELFQTYSFLEYVVRNWTLHFRNSTMYKSPNSFEISSQFKTNFPSSAQLALLEWTCWESQASLHEAVEMHSLALHVRQSTLTEKHKSVIQTLIICGTLHQKLSNTSEAGTCFYRAAHLGQTVLRKNSTVTVTCTTTFLTIVESITSTTRTETITRKEEMLKYIITAYKHQYGRTSDIVIRYYKQLAQLYVEIKEEHHAEEIWRELREIIVVRHGVGSAEEKDITGQITIVLKGGSKKPQDVAEYEKGIFDISMEMEVWDVRRIKITLELAQSYEARSEIFLAEELYVTLWKHLTDQCHAGHHHHHGVDVHISMIEIALEYARFLRRVKRHEEACNVLICIWTEYEEYDFESETLFLRLKEVGDIMRTVGLLTIAISVFKKCWGWFSSHEKHEHIVSCETLISETTQEIVKITTTNTTVSTTTTTTETTVREVFESKISRGEVSTETISISRSLIATCMKQEKWIEAISVTERTLALIWKMIIAGGGTCALPREHSVEAIDLAISLAICHQKTQHYHEAEQIYVRIYHACRNSCQVHDQRMTKALALILQFYQEHGKWSKMIKIHHETLIEYRKHLGPTHALTLKTLYTLGSLCAIHGHGQFHEYYEEIVTVLNGNSGVCHHGALEAMILLCGYYHEEGHFHKLKHTCEVLWESWTRHSLKLETSFVEVLYLRYRYVMEQHFHCEYEWLRTLTITYRDTCKKVFGASVAITILALVEFAQICMRSEKYMHEAITTYEEVLTKTTTTTVTTKVSTTTIMARLTQAYSKVCNSSSVSTTVIEKAIKVHFEHYKHVKATYGYAQVETLKVFRELLLLHVKQKTQESHSVVVRLLTETTIEIVSKEKHSKDLYDAAKILGEIYISCSMIEYGQEVVKELRRQVLTGTQTSGSKLGIKLDPSIGRTSYIFILTLESTLYKSSTISYSQVLADLLTLSVLYESYSRSLKSQSNVEVTLTKYARLRSFLVRQHYREQADTLDRQVFELFVKHWASSIKTRSEITFEFYTTLLQELGKLERTVAIGEAACACGNEKVRQLFEAGDFQRAYEFALCLFQFIAHQRAYHNRKNVGHGFKLSSYMAGRGLPKHLMARVESTLHEQMLKLSRDIIRDVLKACKESQVEYVRMPVGELNQLVGLLGQQKNYEELDLLLTALWESRELHNKWDQDTIIGVGRRLVEVRFLRGDPSRSNDRFRSAATELCEDICYNLRRVWSLDPKALEMSELLSQLYTDQGHYREAMGVHEDILLFAIEGDDGNDKTVDALEPARAKLHLDLLKRSQMRLGGWDKSVAHYQDLVAELRALREFAPDAALQAMPPPERWNAKDRDDGLGRFAAPERWEFVRSEALTEQGELRSPSTPKRPGKRHRVSSNWGMGLVHRFIHGDDSEEEEEDVPEVPKLNGKNGYAGGKAYSNPAIVY